METALDLVAWAACSVTGYDMKLIFSRASDLYLCLYNRLHFFTMFLSF